MQDIELKYGDSGVKFWIRDLELRLGEGKVPVCCI